MIFLMRHAEHDANVQRIVARILSFHFRTSASENGSAITETVHISLFNA